MSCRTNVVSNERHTKRVNSCEEYCAEVWALPKIICKRDYPEKSIILTLKPKKCIRTVFFLGFSVDIEFNAI